MPFYLPVLGFQAFKQSSYLPQTRYARTDAFEEGRTIFRVQKILFYEGSAAKKMCEMPSARSTFVFLDSGQSNNCPTFLRNRMRKTGRSHLRKVGRFVAFNKFYFRKVAPPKQMCETPSGHSTFVFYDSGRSKNHPTFLKTVSRNRTDAFEEGTQNFCVQNILF